MKKKFLLIPSQDFVNRKDKSQLSYIFTVLSFLFIIILSEDHPSFKIKNYNNSKFLSDRDLKFELTDGPNLEDVKFFQLNIVKR